MVDVERVCCMCGDVGFPDKIFRCINCHNRFQHSYCSNYYNESSDPPEICDWCQTDEIRSLKHGGSSKKAAGVSSPKPSEYSGGDNKTMKQHEDQGPEKGKSATGAPSPRTTRRYKLLKDVMC